MPDSIKLVVLFAVVLFLVLCCCLLGDCVRRSPASVVVGANVGVILILEKGIRPSDLFKIRNRR